MRIDLVIESEDKRRLIEEVRCFYRTLDVWHDETHGERVVANAQKLAGLEGVDPELVELGAWVHQYHDNLEELSSLLDSFKLSESLRGELCAIVEFCRPHKISGACSIEAQIVFDADALELMGAYGVVREALCNRECRGLELSEALSQARATQLLFQEKLQTSAARSLVIDSIAVSDAFWADLSSNFQF